MSDTLTAKLKRRKPLGGCSRCGATAVYVSDMFARTLPLTAVVVKCVQCAAQTKPGPIARAFTDWRKGRVQQPGATVPGGSKQESGTTQLNTESQSHRGTTNETNHLQRPNGPRDS